MLDRGHHGRQPVPGCSGRTGRLTSRLSPGARWAGVAVVFSEPTAPLERRYRTVAQVGKSAHIGRLRVVVGHELLLLPSVSVLPADKARRVLLVRHAGHHDGWAVLGGAVEAARYSNPCGLRPS